MAWPELSEQLWRERELLEVLLFKLEEEQLILHTGRTRWLARATREVELVVGEVRRCEVARAVEVDLVAGPLGLGPDVSLGALCAVAPEPWSDILREHRKGLTELTRDIQEIAAGNRELLSAGYRSLRETLLKVHERGDSYDSRGRAFGVVPGARTVDHAL